MNRELIMKTLNILPYDFKMEEFITALYERVHSFQRIFDAENGKENTL